MNRSTSRVTALPPAAPGDRSRPRRASSVLVRSGCAFLAAAMTTLAPARADPQDAVPDIQARDIAPFDIVYDVGNNVITAGLASLTLVRDGDDWVYSLATKPTGVFKLTGKGRIHESSVLDIVRTGDTVELHPRSYAFRQDDETRRSIDAMFDWDARELTWQRRGKEGTIAFDGPLLDRLSVTLAVMHLLRQGFEEIELDIFDSGEIKTMRFVNEGREVLDTKMGDVDTVRVRGENADGGSRSSITWFAPSLDYVPVRIEQRKRNELVARMNLMKLKNRVTDIELADPDALDAGTK